MPSLGLMAIAQQGGDEDYSGKVPAPPTVPGTARPRASRGWAALGLSIVLTFFAVTAGKF